MIQSTDSLNAPVSWAPEVIADSSGKWTGNALRFPDYQSAINWAEDLYCRWYAVRQFRAVESQDPVNREGGAS